MATNKKTRRPEKLNPEARVIRTVVVGGTLYFNFISALKAFGVLGHNGAALPNGRTYAERMGLTPDLYMPSSKGEEVLFKYERMDMFREACKQYIERMRQAQIEAAARARAGKQKAAAAQATDMVMADLDLSEMTAALEKIATLGESIKEAALQAGDYIDSKVGALEADIKRLEDKVDQLIAMWVDTQPGGGNADQPAFDLPADRVPNFS